MNELAKTELKTLATAEPADEGQQPRQRAREDSHWLVSRYPAPVALPNPFTLEEPATPAGAVPAQNKPDSCQN